MPANRPLVMGIRPYTPDMPAFSNGGTMVVRNVLPRTKASYGPLRSLSPYPIPPLPSRCQGAYSAADPNDNLLSFAGTGIDLYRLVSGATAWINASKMAGVYTLATDQFWNWAILKSRIVATNINDPIQSFVMGTSSVFSDLSPDAPKARYAAGIKQWLMVAHTNDPLGGLAPWRIWWSGINDATSWPAPGSNAAAAAQSDYNDLSGENGLITGLVGNLGTSEGAVFFEHAVWRIVYIGPPAVFDFFPAIGVKGTLAPASLVQVGAAVYYLGEDGFYAFDGTSARPIGYEKIDKTFFADLDMDFVYRVVGACDPLNKMVLWAYPGQGHDAVGNCNRLLIYNWADPNWTIADVDTEYLYRSIGINA